jgi:hypothetical protein
VLVPVLIILAAALILGVALLLYGITLSGLGNVLIALGYSSLGIFTTVFALLVAYLSKSIVAYTVGSLILERFAPDSQRRFAALLLGVVLYALLRAIPIVGWVVDVVFTLLGLGAVWLVYQTRTPKPPDAEIAMPATPVDATTV